MQNFRDYESSSYVSSDHYLDNARNVGDTPADRVVSHLVEEEQLGMLYGVLNTKSWKEVREVNIPDEYLKEFLFSGNCLPVWAEPEKIRNASALFRSNGNEFLFMLGIVSLPYCYAAARGALSLYHTEKIRKNTERRLLDTTAFLIEIMRPGAFDEGGDGFHAVKQVRLRHALARYYLLKIPEIQKLSEIPLNQEDMAGTNLAFSYVALKAMPKIGVNFSKETQNDYLHFWSVIGVLLGLEQKLVPSDLKEAYWLERTIARRQFKTSEAGNELTAQLLNHYKAQIPNKMTVLLIKPLMRHLLGEEVSGLIGLESKASITPADFLMTLLPIFKRYIFPPVQSFEFIAGQVALRQKAMDEKSV